MKIQQKKWSEAKGWQYVRGEGIAITPQLVLVFGGRSLLSNSVYFADIRTQYPESHIVMLSTAGEIIQDEVNDNSLSVTAMCFERTHLQFTSSDIDDTSQSHDVGRHLAASLPKDDLKHVMVFSDGLKVNGTSLVHGLSEALPADVSVTGGLVGDGSDFKETLVGFDEAPVSGKVVAIGFYGSDIRVGYGSLGGWDTFGPDRLITKSRDNVLFEIDGRPALSLYKEYLGDQAAGLPSSGLLFPMSLSLKNSRGETVEVVRTLLGVNEEDQSMTFAGDMPEGVYARLMKANFERLIDGASGAANMSIEKLTESNSHPELAILISCIGRKLVLKERIEEEIEAVRQIVGDDAAIAGFYSYGELCPTAATEKQCQLHNQTMTITTFREN